jgi:hypothetical protein
VKPDEIRRVEYALCFCKTRVLLAGHHVLLSIETDIVVVGTIDAGRLAPGFALECLVQSATSVARNGKARLKPVFRGEQQLLLSVDSIHQLLVVSRDPPILHLDEARADYHARSPRRYPLSCSGSAGVFIFDNSTSPEKRQVRLDVRKGRYGLPDCLQRRLIAPIAS